ncbi:MAG: hypothetical protein ACTSYL_04465 [Candidatus Thorarchaeota archaeon]
MGSVLDTRMGYVGRHRRDLLRLRTALLVIAVLSPLWIMPLSAPVVSDVVVVMHHDRAVNTAVQTIVANDPHVRIVEYGSLEYALTIHRTAGRVVWVSHGSEQGILAGPHVLSWRAFSSRIQMTPGKDIVLACDSAKISKYVSFPQVLSFKGIVDAQLGALIISYILSQNSDIIPRINHYIQNMIAGKEQPTLLPTVTESPNFWIRWSIKSAIYLVLTYVFYWAWTIVGNPSIGLTLLMSLAALVAGLYAFARLVGGIAVDILCAGIRLWEHSWPAGFQWIPETIAWAIENAGVFLFGYAVVSAKPIVGLAFSQVGVGLILTATWLAVDYTVEWVFDQYNIFSDY